MKECDHGDHRGSQAAECDQRHRSFICFFAFRDDQACEKQPHDDQRTDREQDDPQVVQRMRLQWWIGREQHIRLAREDHHIHENGAAEHQTK